LDDHVLRLRLKKFCMVFADQSMVAALPDQVSCDLGGRSAILSLKNGTYYGLDEVGARVWCLLQQPRTIADLRSVLRAEYEVAPLELDADLDDLLSRLHRFGLIGVSG